MGDYVADKAAVARDVERTKRVVQQFQVQAGVGGLQEMSGTDPGEGDQAHHY